MQAMKRGRKQATASDVLKHPIRVRILEVINERDLSPIQFLNQDLWPNMGDKSREAQLSFVAYHFRTLEKANCIELVDTIPRRGGTEHVFRGTARAYFSDKEWAKLTPSARREISTTMLQGLIARAEGAIFADTFDARLDRWLAWIPLKMDHQGWKELTTAMAAVYAEVEQIRHDTEKRLAASGEKVIPATFGLLAFESPPIS